MPELEFSWLARLVAVRVRLRSAPMILYCVRRPTFELSGGSPLRKDGSTMSIGSGAGTDFETARGINFPAIRQFTIFLENRVGQLLEVVKRFEGTGIRVCALSINDAAECAFVRFLVSDAERGREILERSGLAIIETDLIGVELPTGPQPLLRVCTALLQAELNIIQAYPLIVRPHGKPAVAIMVENNDLALETLKEKGFRIITEGDLEDDHPGVDQ